MEFRILVTTEDLVHITLQSFEGQIRIIHSLGNHPERARHIEDLKRMIVFLSGVVDKNKDDLIQDLEKVYSTIADELANQQEFVSKVAKHTDEQGTKKFAAELTKAQPKIINTLGMQETKTEKEIFQRFKAMNDKIQELLSRVEGLRR